MSITIIVPATNYAPGAIPQPPGLVSDHPHSRAKIAISAHEPGSLAAQIAAIGDLHQIEVSNGLTEAQLSEIAGKMTAAEYTLIYGAEAAHKIVWRWWGCDKYTGGDPDEYFTGQIAKLIATGAVSVRRK